MLFRSTDRKYIDVFLDAVRKRKGGIARAWRSGQSLAVLRNDSFGKTTLLVFAIGREGREMNLNSFFGKVLKGKLKGQV